MKKILFAMCFALFAMVGFSDDLFSAGINQAAGTGGFIGYVVDEFGDPVVGATVTVVGPENSSPAIRRYVVTDIDGLFIISGLPEGMYFFFIEFVGKKRVTGYVYIIAGQVTHFSDPIVMEDGGE